MTQSAGGEAGREGFSALKNLVATLLDWQDAPNFWSPNWRRRFRLMSLWAKAIGAAFLLALGVVMLVCCIALAFWEQRVIVFGIFAALFVGGGLVLASSLKRQASQPSKMFKASLSELEADMAQLRRSRNKPE
jgi:hypothetical protein